MLRAVVSAILLTVAGIAQVTACSTGGPDRGPTAVMDAEFVPAEGGVVDGRELHLTVAACNASPEVIFEEIDDRIVVSVVADLPGRDTDGCADEATIVLDEPLGERELIDASTGESIPIIDPETGEPIDS